MHMNAHGQQVKVYTCKRKNMNRGQKINKRMKLLCEASLMKQNKKVVGLAGGAYVLTTQPSKLASTIYHI